jgi:hypothetical protein
LLINEFAQWAVLLLLVVFVFGLTRQLGNFLVPASEARAREVGPDIGKRLPSWFFEREEYGHLLQLMEERQSDRALLLVVSEVCVQCSEVVHQLRTNGARGAPIVALSRQSSSEHRALLEDVADLVIVDEDRLTRAHLTVAPFALIADRQLTVHDKQFVGKLDDLLRIWTGRSEHQPSGTNGASSDSAPTVIQVGGKQP